MGRFWRVFSAVLTLALLGLFVLGILNMQAIEDWLRLRNYEPPATITRIVRADRMTKNAERIFYITHPELIGSADTFRQNCPTIEQTIVLGCYRSGLNTGIYIYNIDDSRLNGVVEVTAAHEMLHAAYDRLSQNEQQRVNELLNDYYTNDLKDKRIIETIDSYKKSEPTELINEMHSIFATEIRNLPTELEAYYQKYFNQRSAVVSFAERYGDEFTRRINKIKDYEQQLAALKKKIASEESALAGKLSKIESDRRNLNSLRASGQVAAYNAAVDDFNTEVENYNSAVNRLKDGIAEFNRLVAAHNALASELRSLYDSLDTSLKPQSEQ